MACDDPDDQSQASERLTRSPSGASRNAKLGLESIHDETTIFHVRNYLETRNLAKKLFEATKQYLSERGLMLTEGTIVDPSSTSAPSLIKNEKRERDPEMKQNENCNLWRFGMKPHINTDTNTTFTV